MRSRLRAWERLHGFCYQCCNLALAEHLRSGAWRDREEGVGVQEPRGGWGGRGLVEGGCNESEYTAPIDFGYILDREKRRGMGGGVPTLLYKRSEYMGSDRLWGCARWTSGGSRGSRVCG